MAAGKISTKAGVNGPSRTDISGYCIQPKKKIRAAHARRNNKYEKTCYYPNRLNLLTWTALCLRRSKKVPIFAFLYAQPVFRTLDSTG
jgi:hypothetical protein